MLEGKTIPYNAPDVGEDPDLWLDFVSLGPGINPTTKNLDKDVHDVTYWQSKKISAVVMPWMPYFSNCDGHDSRMIFYDLFEYNQNEQCTTPSYKDIRIVNPIPATGLEAVADRCTLNIQCRYDEDLTFKRSQTTRWYNIQEPTRMFYLTREPVPLENYHKLEDSDIEQTYYNSLIEDGSDELISVFFIPESMSGIPRTVEIDFLYY